MARTLKIVAGSLFVDLLDNTSFAPNREGLIPLEPDQFQVRRESAFSEGSSLVLTKALNVTETYQVRLTSASHDAVAAALQTLAAIQEMARQFHISLWQKTPVYLESQTAGESNKRYAAVYDIRIRSGDSFYGKAFEHANWLDRLTITVEREPYWGPIPPLTMPTSPLMMGAPQAPGPQVDATEQFLVNFRDSSALTHLFNEDNSAATFSANLIAAALPYSYFPSPAGVNDAVYFGCTTGPFRMFILNLTTAFSGNCTFVWEFWNGAIWQNLAGAIRSQNSDTSPWAAGQLGRRLVIVDTPTGWASTTVNGVAGFWVRNRISAFTSMSTNPQQGGQAVYNPRDCKITVDAAQILGDVDALGYLRLHKWFFTTHNINLVAVGMKSRGLSNFTSRINFGAGNPVGWSITNSLDTSTVSDIESPGGSHALCTFATNQSMVSRVTLTLSSANAADFEGDYHVYLRCQQIGGSAGDVSVRVGLNQGAQTPFTTPVLPQAVGGGIELLSIGRITITPARVLGSETSPALVVFFIQASSTSATPDLRFYDLILMPIDEWAMLAGTDPFLDGTLSAVGGALDIDGGILRKASTLKTSVTTSNQPVDTWQTRGALPVFPHDRPFNLYFLFSRINTAYLHIAPNYLGGSLNLWAKPRWAFLRGSE